ncbi:MAG: threonine--tRNA ligase [Candidatus Paceibacterota bacterium]|jgi:threonyl-tRNA synthetase
MEKIDKSDNMRHTLAHLLAASVGEIYKFDKIKLTLGPAIENGFYYDIDFGDEKITDANLKKIEDVMRKKLPKWTEWKHKELTKEEALNFFKNEYKAELINEIAERGEKITTYTCGGFTDLCRGGHLKNPAKEIDPESFKLDRIAGAYWRGDEKNKMLTRIYGLAFETKEELGTYIAQRTEAEKRDHKKLGKELDLFVIDEKVGKGLPMWTPKGTAIKFELQKFTRELEQKYGYQHVETPYLGGEELYRTSGHLDHYSKNMYAPIDMDGNKFYLRPMACPHHIRMYQRRPWSYKELPIRYAEIADYNRYEKSGELMGMMRVRKFQLTDGHLFVTPEGLKEEFKLVCNMIVEGMKGLGFIDIVSYRFSKRDPKNKEKYYPDDNLWNQAENLMKEALDELKLNYVEAEDEAAFYGPKLDVQAKNVNGKEDTLFTAQMDFLLPEKFEIEYIDRDGKKKRPVMIHRSTIGSLERVFGFLIEHYAGAFPLWLAPVQVKVIPVRENHNEYAKKIAEMLKENNIRVEFDDKDENLGTKVRDAKNNKIPYWIVIGDKEIEAKKVTLESRDKGQLGQMSKEELVSKFLEEIQNKK